MDKITKAKKIVDIVCNVATTVTLIILAMNIKDIIQFIVTLFNE